MRSILRVLSLLIALLVFGLLLKSQLAAKSVVPTSPLVKPSNSSPVPSRTEPVLQNQAQQIWQIQEQVRESVGAALQRSDKLNDE